MSPLTSAWMVQVTESKNGELAITNFCAGYKENADAVAAVRIHRTIPVEARTRVEAVTRLSRESILGIGQAYGLEDGQIMPWPMEMQK